MADENPTPAAAVDHAEVAAEMAGFLTEGSGDPRNPGSIAHALTAQVHASLAIVDQLERLNETLSSVVGVSAQEPFGTNRRFLRTKR